jgi:periplasmic protein TonB
MARSSAVDGRLDWTKYILAALAIHAAVLFVPVAQKATVAVKQRVIDVVVMRQEAVPPPPPPKVEKRTIVQKPEPARVRVPERVVRPPVPEKVMEKKEEPPPSGAGNVLDEKIVAQVAPGPATGGSEGVGIAGVNTAGGKIGLGGGGTVKGTGVGTGSATTPQASSGPTGPLEMRFGEAGGPQFLAKEPPEYPLIAQKMKKEGRVIVRVTIDEKGKLIKAEVVEATDEYFKQAALEAAKSSKYLPGQRNGVPVATRADIPYRFTLKK